MKNPFFFNAYIGYTLKCSFSIANISAVAVAYLNATVQVRFHSLFINSLKI